MHDDTETIALRCANDLPNTDLLGKRPAIILGCDTREIMTVATLALLISLVVVLLISLFIGFAFFPLFFFLFYIILAVLGLLFLRSQKRQKPYGFYLQKLSIALARLSPKPVYIQGPRVWDTRRQRVRHR